MRNIKFRIYFKDEEEFMTKPITIEDLLHEDWIDFENEKGTLSLPLKDFRFFYGKNENYEIMQYTGLKDKNGKEIYEGDIVLYQDWEQCYEGGGNDSFINKGIVEYNESNCCFNVTERATIDIEDVLYEGNEDLEVIGNIYDNPELLEEGE